MKKYIENFYYGLLIAGFCFFMEYWQEGKVGKYVTIWCMITPFYTTWFLTKFIRKKVRNNHKK